MQLKLPSAIQPEPNRPMNDAVANDSPFPARLLVGLLKIVIGVLFGGALASAIGLRAFAPDQTFRLMGPLFMLTLSLSGAYFLWRRQIVVTVRILVFGSWLSLTCVLLFTDGLRAPAVIAYPLVIMITGWLINARAAIISMAATIAVTLLFGVLDAKGIFPQGASSSPLVRVADQVVIYLLCGALAAYFVRNFQRQLQRHRKVSRDLAKRTSDLEAKTTELQRAQAVAKVGSWVCDIHTGLLELSPEACRILSVPVGTVETIQTFFLRVHPDDRDTILRAWQDMLCGKPLRCEHRLLERDSIRWLHQQAELEHHAEERGLRAVGICEDVTDRKLAQIATEDSERRYRTMIEWTPEAIAVHRDWTLLYVNPAAIRTLGARTSEDLVGRNIMELVHPDFHERVRKRVEYQRSVNASVPLMQEKFLRLDGTEIDVEVQAASIVFGGQPAIQVAMHDITERVKAEKEIHVLAFYDPLTQLPNRRLLMDRLSQAIAISASAKRFGAIYLIDLDDFKALNDTRGHAMGDRLLVLVAERLIQSMRQADTVARLGGDEFVILVEGLGDSKVESLAQAQLLGDKVLLALNQPYQLDNQAQHCSTSIGVALFDEETASIDELLKCADLAMYQAKAAGRNRLRFFKPEMQADVSSRVALEADLRFAIDQGQFILYYQAQVVGLGRLTGAEVLVRWQHPQRGLVSPAEFIRLAEETGLILPLGNWVLDQACQQLAVWALRPEMAHLKIAVNVSMRQFHQPDFAHRVQDALRRSGAAPQNLKLELTESLMVDNVLDVVNKMAALKAQGLGFSLDDFGTGYSSLAYLKRLPLDQLKIDQSFVHNILTDGNDAAIAKMVISLADSLGLTVIAEGVELEAQRAFLADHGCHAYQGYLFSKPVPLVDFETYAAQALGA
jgi:diguanylate cyclase (GGDEF)-like protein/PAS domain S-box-containing protein